MTNIVTYPTNPVQGQEFTVGETIKIWDGEKWVNKTPTNNPHNVTKSQVGLGSVDNVSSANLRNRGTHTGTQTLSTISDAGSAASKNTATTAEAIAGTSNKLTDTIGVHAALDEYGIGKGFPSEIIDFNKMGFLGSGFYRTIGTSLNALNGASQSVVINIKRAGSGTEGEIDGGQLIIGSRVAGFRFGFDTAYANVPFIELYHTENLIHARNLSGATVAPNATTSGANLNPAKTGTWRNVSAVDALNNGYGLWEIV